MESPSGLSRSPSASSFGPGRRSHPNLQHLSLAPLAAKYPIEPTITTTAATTATTAAEYASPLQPSRSVTELVSITHVSALPSPDGMFSNSPPSSRAPSRPRLKRGARSHTAINLAADLDGNSAAAGATPSGALTSHGFGHSGFRHGHSHSHGHSQGQERSRSQLHLKSLKSSEWLVQTGLTLTASSRENKGQSWIVQRDSTTSLASLRAVSVEESAAAAAARDRQLRALQAQAHAQASSASRPGSRPTSRTGSRAGSRAGSRSRRSRRELAMTSVVNAGAGADADVDADGNSTNAQAQLPRLVSAEDIRPDWADPDARAETAARAAAAATAELTEDDHEQLAAGYESDPYGMLNFEDQIDMDLDSEDEREVRKELFAGGHNGWFDGVIDVLLRIDNDSAAEVVGAGAGELNPETLDQLQEIKRRRGEGVAVENVVLKQDQPHNQYGNGNGRGSGNGNGNGQGDEEEETLPDDQVVAPPGQPQSMWDDVRWFGRLLAKTVAS